MSSISRGFLGVSSFRVGAGMLSYYRGARMFRQLHIVIEMTNSSYCVKRSSYNREVVMSSYSNLSVMYSYSFKFW